MILMGMDIHPNIRTVIARKNEMLALLTIIEIEQQARVVTTDPRRPEPSVRVYDDPRQAAREFAAALSTTRKRGWTVVYDGPPLLG